MNTQEGQNDEIRSNHEQELSEISHGAKKLKINNKLNDVDSYFIKYFETKKKNITATPESADQKFLLSLLPDVKLMNCTQKRQFKRKVLDVIGYISEDPDSLNVSSRSSVANYSSSSMIPESRTDNENQQYDPADSSFGYSNMQQ